jgi:hypothetical protein
MSRPSFLTPELTPETIERSAATVDVRRPNCVTVRPSPSLPLFFPSSRAASSEAHPYLFVFIFFPEHGRFGAALGLSQPDPGVTWS